MSRNKQCMHFPRKGNFMLKCISSAEDSKSISPRLGDLSNPDYDKVAVSCDMCNVCIVTIKSYCSGNS